MRWSDRHPGRCDTVRNLVARTSSGSQVGGGDDRTDQQVRAQRTREQVSVLSVEAETRLNRGLTIQKRCGIHKYSGPTLGFIRLSDERCKRIHAGLEHVMVVGSLGVSGNSSTRAAIINDVRLIGVVGDAQ